MTMPWGEINGSWDRIQEEMRLGESATVRGIERKYGIAIGHEESKDLLLYIFSGRDVTDEMIKGLSDEATSAGYQTRTDSGKEGWKTFYIGRTKDKFSYYIKIDNGTEYTVSFPRDMQQDKLKALLNSAVVMLGKPSLARGLGTVPDVYQKAFSDWDTVA